MDLNSKGDKYETVIQKNSGIAIIMYNGDNDATECSGRNTR